jgi:hypothetical protein
MCRQLARSALGGGSASTNECIMSHSFYLLVECVVNDDVSENACARQISAV